jgi:hypothetical protein
MELITKYPILIDPTSAQKDNFRFTPNTKGYPGSLQTTQVGDLVVKGNTPVFEGDHEVTKNDFIYLNELKNRGEVLTPMDEWLYSERNISEGGLGFGEFENWGDVFSNADNLNKKDERRINREARRKAAKDKANQTTPGNGEPSAKEQDDAAKKGKFWNVLKGGWDTLSKSPTGQIILDSATNYLSNRLNGGQGSPGDDAPLEDPKKDPKKDDEAKNKTNKYLMIGGAVVLAGIVIYALFNASKK